MPHPLECINNSKQSDHYNFGIVWLIILEDLLKGNLNFSHATEIFISNLDYLIIFFFELEDAPNSKTLIFFNLV